MFDTLTRRVFQPLAGIALLAMMFVMAGNAVGRVLTDSSPGWVLTFLTELAMPAVVFLGLLHTTLHHGHVRVTSFAEKLPRTVQVGIRMLAWVAGIAFLLPIGIANGVQAIERIGEPGGQSWAVPPALAYGMVSLTTLLSCLILVSFLLNPRTHAVGEDPNAVAASTEP